MPDVTVKVFHNISRDASFGLNTLFVEDPGAPLMGAPRGYTKIAAEGDDRHGLVLVFEYPVSADAEDSYLLDSAFEAFNIGEHGIAGPYRARRLRSLSVGDVIVIGGRAWSCESLGWKRREPGELRDVTEIFDPCEHFGYDYAPPSVTVPWDPQATGFCQWCGTVRPIMEVEPFNPAGNLACQDTKACGNRIHEARGGGFCLYCRQAVVTEENGQVTGDDEDYCPESADHFHSIPLPMATVTA